MKAWRFEHKGRLEALSWHDVALPPLAPGEVRVEVRAAGLNPSDVKNVLGRFAYTTLPRTPGRDFAGVIVEGPEDMIGAEVWGTGRELGFTRDGSHAEEIVLPVTGVAPKPRSLTFEQAAACGVPYTTAWDAVERAQVARGTRVLLIGYGAVGRAAYGLARARGAEVVVAVRRPEQLEELRARHPRAVLLGEEGGLAAAVHAEMPAGVDVVFDTTGFWLAPAINCVAPFGRIAVIAAPADGHVNVPVLNLYRRGATIVGVNSLLYDAATCAKFLDPIGAAFDDGELALPEPPRPRALEDALAAYHEVEAGRADKTVLVPHRWLRG